MGTGERVAFRAARDRLVQSSVPRRARPRIVIVDERRLFAEALVALIESIERAADGELIACSASAGAIAAMAPDFVLVAVGAEREEPLRLVTALTEHSPRTRIALIADECDSELVGFVLDNDVAGLLLSDSTAADLSACIQQIMQGHTVLPSSWHRAIDAHDRDPVAALSERQLQVLALIADGHSYGEIASALFISVNTVKFHVRLIYQRLGVHNRMAAARLFAEHGSPVGAGRRSAVYTC